MSVREQCIEMINRFDENDVNKIFVIMSSLAEPAPRTEPATQKDDYEKAAEDAESLFYYEQSEIENADSDSVSIENLADELGITTSADKKTVKNEHARNAAAWRKFFKDIDGCNEEVPKFERIKLREVEI